MQLFLKNQTTKRMLMSSFNGKPAPGGIFDPATRIYCKRIGEKAYYWPEKAYPVDQPVVNKLQELECQTMLMVVVKKDNSCETFQVNFNYFLKNSRKIDWPLRGDNRFPVRRYLSLSCWEKIENTPEWAGDYYYFERSKKLYSNNADYHVPKEAFKDVPDIFLR